MANNASAVTWRLPILADGIGLLRKSRSLRSVFIVASGTAGAQVIGVAFSPLITRIYSPEAFGLLGTFLAIMTVVTPVSAFCYPIAIILPKEDAEARSIARLSMYLAVALAGVFTLFLVLGTNWLVALLSLESIRPFLMLIPIFIVLSAWDQVAGQWLIRKQRFAMKSRILVIQTLLLSVFKVGVGWFYPFGAVLIILTTVGKACHAAMMNLGMRRAGDKAIEVSGESGSRPSLGRVARKYYDFPLYRSPQMFINAFSQGLPILMLAAYFGPAPAGFYTLCKKLLTMPSSLIGKSIGDVFYPRIAEASHRGENIRRLLLKATLALGAASLLPFLVVIGLGPWLFGVVFGQDWAAAGYYARWLSILIFFTILSRPSVISVPIIKRQGFFLGFEVVTTCAMAAGLLLGYYIFNSDIMAIGFFSVAGAVANFFLVLYVISKTPAVRQA